LGNERNLEVCSIAASHSSINIKFFAGKHKSQDSPRKDEYFRLTYAEQALKASNNTMEQRALAILRALGTEYQE
jgi:hypothetical protein